MRVLQVVTTRRSFFDQQVAALERAGVECDVLAVPNRGTGGRSVADYLRFLPAVRRRARAGFDLVHANCGLTAPAAFAQPVRPVVVTFWGTDLMGDETATDRLVSRVSRIAARLADAVVLPSRAMAAHLDREYSFVPFGVDGDRFRPIPRPFARERVGWAQDERVVLFPYDPSRPEKDYGRAETVVDRLPVEATLRTISGVPYDEMPYYLNASDAVLVTSRRESGPMVVKEAVACGVPVVSTDVGFVREAVADVPTGAVSDSTAGLVEALAEVLRLDRADRARVPRSRPAADGGESSEREPEPGADRLPESRPRGRRRPRQGVVGPDDTAARLLQVYERVLAARGRSP